MLEGLSDDSTESKWLLNDEKELKADRDQYKDSGENESAQLFDAVERIGHTKEPLEINEETTWYNQFFINNAFSQHIDTVLSAYNVNICGTMSDEMHYHYMNNSIKPYKRRGKWAKLEDDTELIVLVDVFARYNEINRHKARQYVLAMNKDRLGKFKSMIKPMAVAEIEEILKRFPNKAINATKQNIKKTW